MHLLHWDDALRCFLVAHYFTKDYHPMMWVLSFRTFPTRHDVLWLCETEYMRRANGFCYMRLSTGDIYMCFNATHARLYEIMCRWELLKCYCHLATLIEWWHLLVSCEKLKWSKNSVFCARNISYLSCWFMFANSIYFAVFSESCLREGAYFFNGLFLWNIYL